MFEELMEHRNPNDGRAKIVEKWGVWDCESYFIAKITNPSLAHGYNYVVQANNESHALDIIKWECDILDGDEISIEAATIDKMAKLFTFEHGIAEPC